MYEYIKGTLTHIYPSYLVIENQGIGYHILMANPFRFTDYLNQETTIYLYQNVTQDDMNLFGFKNREEKELFLKLIGVSGIGPKSALAILANEDHIGLITAIEQEDTKFLQKFPGVGKKTAAQIVLDLKGKLSELTLENYDGTAAQTIEADSGVNPALQEAIEALYALGYGQREVKKVRPAIEELEVTTTDAYIREALSQMMKK
jgi:Holliday junction DNA helicase RuvA